MKHIRNISHIISPPTPHMVGDGFKVHNFLPGNGFLSNSRLSPFFLMDYGAKFNYSATDKPRGVGVHPHRGFETVTIVYHGKLAHHDSAGNSGVIAPGDVQWMTAASGVLHKEYHDKEWSKTGGDMQMLQLWVNLPARYKMVPPKYQALLHKDLGKFILPNNQGLVEVIAGNFNGTKGPAFTFTPIEMYNLRLNKDATLTLSLAENFNTAFLIIEGSVLVNDNNVETNHLVVFENNGTEIKIQTIENAVVVVLSGEPLNEPIYSYGPFLMNTKQEIIQAFDDLNNGLFGFLED